MNIKQEHSIKRWLLFFIIALFISGLTAMPVDIELNGLLQLLPKGSFYNWIYKILVSYQATKAQYPFLLYGYDWLAFAHFVLAILFIGPYRNPVQNIWVVQFGLMACVLVIPFALVIGIFRSIPVGWRLVDCSFGVVGFAVLWPCYKRIKKLIALPHSSTQSILV